MPNDILLDYAFNVVINPAIPTVSTAWLKDSLAIVKPKSGVTPGTITKCISAAEIAAITDNTQVAEYLTAGKSYIYVLAVASLADIDAAMVADTHRYKYYTIIISNDFVTADLTTADYGDFTGVVAKCFADQAEAKAFGVTENRCAFYVKTATNIGKNMFYAFGKLFSAVSWKNQQFITMPYDDGIYALGDAESAFNDRVSFTLTSDDFGKKLGFFVVGQKAIIAPYIFKEMVIELQNRAVQYINTNQPQYTVTQGTLLENALQEDVIDDYIKNNLVSSGSIKITVDDENFEATGTITVPTPTALWRVSAELVEE